MELESQESVNNFSKELCEMAWRKYQKKEFDHIAYAEPLYIKEFYSTQKTN